MGLEARIDLRIGATLSTEMDLDSVRRVPLQIAKALQLSNGTGEGEADLLWFDTRGVLAGSFDDLDLAGGLIDPFGQALNFASVKGIFIYAHPDNANELEVGGGSSPFASWLGAAGDAVVVRPGGMFLLTAPDATAYEVTPVTGDVLRIIDAGLTPAVGNYDIALLGASA
jgi:hypothetical protein